MAENDNEKQLAIQKIYVKDFSFESPKTPQIFSQNDLAPKTDLNLRSTHTVGSENNHEIVLTITIEAKDDDNTIFLIELHQAGLFHISGYNDEEFKAIVGSFCPNILFPYARETIAGIVSKGGFPEFILQPINFDALYAQGLAQAEQEQKDSDSETEKTNGEDSSGATH
tara:strand:+ start:81 stop:587 length:507 start_codon:yes stop_codon:yes gene_type:complete